LFFNQDTISSFTYRPQIIPGARGLSIKTNFKYSFSTSPNLDNVGNLFSLKGNNYYYGMTFQYLGKNLIILLEPYMVRKENILLDQSFRGGRYRYTNEAASNYQTRPLISSGIRESLLFFHYNYLGVGISNINQWLGPGIHNTLTMTNNTKGFNQYFIGTLNEKLITKNIGFEGRYTFSKLNNRSGGVYLTNLALLFTFHSDIEYKFGLIRDFLSGGILSKDNRQIKKSDAMQLVFGPLFADSKKSLDYTTDWGFEPWDQIITGIFEINPNKNTRIYIEIGTGDHRKNMTDLLAHWDHNIAYVLGFRKYFQYSFNKYLIGFEYTNLTGNSNTRKFRASGPWYDVSWYEYSSYYGRHWASHAGSDSDDLLIILGKETKKNSLIILLSREQKGLYLESFPEIKTEMGIQFSQLLQPKINLITYFEKESHRNYCFVENETRNNYSISFEIELLF